MARDKEIRCTNCNKALLLERRDGLFLRNKGVMFDRDIRRTGRILCKHCGAWVKAPIYLRV